MFLIKISDGLLETMTLAAIEAYCLGDGRKKADQLEAHGLIWGYVKDTEDQKVFYLDRGSVSISAQMHNEWVKPKPEEIELKDFIVTRWAPQLTLLGTFHTHPYADLDDVASSKGYEFSEGDYDYMRDGGTIWERAGGSVVHLAMAMCKLKSVHSKTEGKWIRNNVWQYDVGNYRFWINACVGYTDEDEQILTANTRSEAVLDLGTRFYNQSGDHIDLT